MSEMKIASRIAIDQRGLVIEGRRLPFYLAPEAIAVQADEHVSRVTVTLLADAVEIDKSLVIETDGDVTLISQSDTKENCANE